MKRRALLHPIAAHHHPLSHIALIIIIIMVGAGDRLFTMVQKPCVRRITGYVPPWWCKKSLAPGESARKEIERELLVYKISHGGAAAERACGQPKTPQAE